MRVAKNRPMVLLTALSAMLFFLSSCARNPENAKMKFLESGKKFMDRGEYSSAAIEFRNALKVDPRFAEAYYQLAQAELAQEHWTGAYNALQQTIELAPARSDARLDRARLYLGAHEFPQAMDDASFVVQNEPSNPEGYRLLGGALAGEDKKEEALAAFQRVIVLRPDAAKGYLDVAVTEVALRRMNDAEKALKKAVELNPNLDQAYADLANFYCLQKKLPEAERTLQEGIQQNPQSVFLRLSQAELLASQGKKDGAFAVLDQLVRQQPKSIEAALAVAAFCLRRGDRERALAEYRRGLNLDPKNLVLQKQLEDSFLTLGDTSTAAELDATLMKSDASDVNVRLNHGRLLLAQGKAQDAVALLQKLTSDAADSSQVHYFLAIAYSRDGDRSQADAELHRALSLTPDSPQILRALAEVNLQLGNGSAAGSYAQKLLQKGLGDVGAKVLMAGALRMQAKLTAALSTLEEARKVAPNDASVHLAIAQVRAAANNWSQAEKEFDAALQLDPHNGQIVSQMADYYIARKQPEKVLSRVQSWVNNNSGDSVGHVVLGTIDQDVGNLSPAQSEFEQAIRLDSNQAMPQLRLGHVYELQGRDHDAASQYEKALSLQPKSASIMVLLGNLYQKQYKWDKAGDYFQKALDADPNSAVAANNLAWLDALDGKNLDLALGLAQKAKSLAPENITISDTLAWVMFKRGDSTGAIPLLQECVRKSPDLGEFHYHLGMALMAAGKQGKGKMQLEAALRMKLDADEAQQARQVLSQVN